MRNLLWIILAIALSLLTVNCSANKLQKHSPDSNLQIIDGEEMLVGNVNYGEIVSHFENWQEADASAEVSRDLVARMQQISEPVEVDCYLGTWCSDSRHGVPPFVQALKAAKNPNITLKIFAVNRAKTDPLRAANDIQRVPTFILKQKGKEIARMIEFPMQDNFVQDFLMIMGN